MVPFDDQSPFITSGIRIGTAAVTTRGLVESDVIQIVDWIDQILQDSENDQLRADIKEEVNKMMDKFPVFA